MLLSCCTGLSRVAYDASRAEGEYLFNGCSGLTEVTLGASVRVLPAGIFGGCAALQTVKGGKNLEEIGAYAFDETGLSSFAFPSTLRLLGSFAFARTGLTEAVLPESLDSIGEWVFSDCKLERLSVDGSPARMDAGAFYGCEVLRLEWNVPESEMSFSRGIDCKEAVIGSNVRILPGNFLGNSDVASVMFEAPSSLVALSAKAFYGCRSLVSVTLPASLEEVRASAFQNCTSLQEMEFPEGMTAIGEKAFYRCTGLKRLGFPTTLASIGAEAFSECTGLEEIDCPVAQPIPIDILVFWNVPSTCVLRIPEGSLMDYLNATRWGGFDIEEVPVSVPSVELSEEFRSVVRLEAGGMTLTPEAGHRVEVYTADGRCVYSGMGAGRIELAQGVYLVRVGGQTGRVLVE